MNLKERLKKREYEGLWQEYCGFWILISDYMKIQKRLMAEQIEI
jgi:hypothetical protein